MNILAMTLTNGTLTVVTDNGNVVPVRNDHPRWTDILDAYKTGNNDRVLTLLSLQAVVNEYSVGDLALNATGILYRGRPLHTLDAERVMAFLKEGLPYKPLANYMARKMANSSARAITELYPFLEHRNMPITDRGFIIAYKGVELDFYSVMGNTSTVVLEGTVNAEGHILNTVGSKIRIERSSCDDDYRNGCSFGLHAGSLEYAKGWGKRVILVEIDPADVVSVPSDCNCQKLRCCGYTVVGEYTGPMPSAYTPEFSSTPDSDNNEDDNDNTDECDGHDDCGCDDCCSNNEDDSDDSDDSGEEVCVVCDSFKDYCVCNNPPDIRHTNKDVENELEKVAVECGVIDGELHNTISDGESLPTPIPWTTGYNDGFKEEKYPKYLPGDENGADSENHRLYIKGYLEGYAFNHLPPKMEG